MEKIKILKIEEGKAPFVKEIANELKDCQAEVGGLIDCVCFEDGCLAVVNDEGKINGMKPNRRNGNDIICGPFFICGSNREGDFISLTEEQIEDYTKKFGEIEQFTGHEPELVPRMIFLGFQDAGHIAPREPACGAVCPHLKNKDKVTDGDGKSPV